MGTHPIFESDFDCLTEKMFRTSLLNRIRSSQMTPKFVARDEVSDQWILRKLNANRSKSIKPITSTENLSETIKKLNYAEGDRVRAKVQGHKHEARRRAINKRVLSYKYEQQKIHKMDLPVPPKEAMDTIIRPAQFHHEANHKFSKWNKPTRRPLLRPWHFDEIVEERDYVHGGKDQADFNNGEVDSFFGKFYNVQQHARDVYYEQIGFVDADDELCHAVKLVGIKTENTPYRDIFGNNKVIFGKTSWWPRDSASRVLARGYAMPAVDYHMETFREWNRQKAEKKILQRLDNQSETGTDHTILELTGKQDTRRHRDSHMDFEWLHIQRCRIKYEKRAGWRATPATVSRGLLMTEGFFIDESLIIINDDGEVGPLDKEPRGKLSVTFDLSKFGAGKIDREVELGHRSEKWKPFPFLKSNFHQNYSTYKAYPSRTYRQYLMQPYNHPRPFSFDQWKKNPPLKKEWTMAPDTRKKAQPKPRPKPKMKKNFEKKKLTKTPTEVLQKLKK